MSDQHYLHDASVLLWVEGLEKALKSGPTIDWPTVNMILEKMREYTRQP